MKSLLYTLLASFVVIAPTSSQLVGTDICACQPSVYKFKLDFSNVCPDGTVEGPGITETTCIVVTRDMNENATNPFPISISEVQVLELDQTLQPVANSVYRGPFFDQDEISYTSITVTEPGTINPETVPRGFQIFITGINSDEEPIVNQLAITYSNDCGIFPLLTVGDIIGWAEFVSTLLRMRSLERSERKISTPHHSHDTHTSFVFLYCIRRTSGSPRSSSVRLRVRMLLQCLPSRVKRNRQLIRQLCLEPIRQLYLKPIRR